MIQSSYASHQNLGFRVLNPEQLHEIVQAAYLILERTGARIDHEPMKVLLKKAGAEIKNNRVYVPRWLTRECLDKAPKGIMVYNRKGQPAMHLDGHKTYYGTSTASPKNRDALTGQVHETTLADIATGIKVADALEHLDFVMPFGSAQDCPSPVAEAHEYLAVVKNTVKPAVFCGYSPKGTETVLDMAAAIAGGHDELRRKPMVIPYPEPIAPLYWPDDIVDKILICAKHGTPHITTGAQLLSLTAPVTIAGGLAQSTAESLFSNVMAQTAAQGTPVFLAAIVEGVNPRNGLISMGGPEYQLSQAAQAEIARYLGLPSWGCAGITDSKIIDAQAGVESAISIFIQALAGVNLVHDVGYLDSGIQCSAAMMVLGDEIISMVKHMMKGIVVDADTLATEVIDRVGPNGNFMTQKHTIKHLRQSLWSPSLFCKEGQDSWAALGSRSTQEAADQKVKDIVAKHVPEALDPKLEEELTKIIGAAEKN